MCILMIYCFIQRTDMREEGNSKRESEVMQNAVFMAVRWDSVYTVAAESSCTFSCESRQKQMIKSTA